MSQHPQAHLIQSLERKIAEKEAQLARLLASGVHSDHRLAHGLHVIIGKLKAQVEHVRHRDHHEA